MYPKSAVRFLYLAALCILVSSTGCTTISERDLNAPASVERTNSTTATLDLNLELQALHRSDPGPWHEPSVYQAISQTINSAILVSDNGDLKISAVYRRLPIGHSFWTWPGLLTLAIIPCKEDFEVMLVAHVVEQKKGLSHDYVVRNHYTTWSSIFPWPRYKKYDWHYAEIAKDTTTVLLQKMKSDGLL